MKKEQSCTVLIRHLQNTLEKQLNSAMQDLDITMSQAGALAAISESPNGQITLKGLEKKIQLSQSVTAGIVTRMEQKGYIESFGSPEDKRIKILRITPLGIEQCNNARIIFAGIEKKFLSVLTKTEQENLYLTLKKLSDATK